MVVLFFTSLYHKFIGCAVEAKLTKLFLKEGIFTILAAIIFLLTYSTALK